LADEVRDGSNTRWSICDGLPESELTIEVKMKVLNTSHPTTSFMGKYPVTQAMAMIANTLPVERELDL